MKEKRIVITGLGVVSPNGVGYKQFLSALKKGTSGIRFFQELKDLNFRCQVAGKPNISETFMQQFQDKYALNDVISSGILYGCMAGLEAWNDAQLPISSPEDAPDKDSGCIFGTGSNGAEATLYQINFEREKRQKLVPSIPVQSLASAVSIELNRILGFGGQVITTSSACNTGTEALLMAYDKIKRGDATRFLVGSSESYGSTVIAPFDAMFATAQEHNHEPKKASCPLSANATGFVPGSGGGALVVENLDSAQKRGAKIYAEILGGHINSGGQRGGGSMTIGNIHGMIRCIKMAVKNSKLSPKDIDLISGHLTSTIGDEIEIESWVRALQLEGTEFPYINSTKSMIGHSLSASGSIESVAAIMQLYHHFIHPSINALPLHPDVAKFISPDCVPQKTIANVDLNIIAKISLGFGDVNSCIFFKKWTA